jgi:hypothetical protein
VVVDELPGVNEDENPSKDGLDVLDFVVAGIP